MVVPAPLAPPSSLWRWYNSSEARSTHATIRIQVEQLRSLWQAVSRVVVTDTINVRDVATARRTEEAMQVYQQELIVAQDGTLTLRDLPLRAGEKVEIIIIVQLPATQAGERYPLRGTPIRYTEPTDDTNWDAAA